MDTENLKKSITELINGLLYFSESEFPLEILNLEKQQTETFQAFMSKENNGAIPESFSASAFFDRYIFNMESSGDAMMLTNAAGFKKLQHFLEKNTASVTVWKCGKTRIGIYIVVKTLDNQIVVIKTFTVET